ncbi:Hypothetical_protein [Hexamita inflata]|uniref:Hypothetical_protein n=1 Tax=Hexamita inflata TaxID=28002 RepID=A0AA86ULL3_9EUKA|nr:Hypothetical protein HINF_LOCUS43742 [Hexamita inflata]
MIIKIQNLPVQSAINEPSGLESGNRSIASLETQMVRRRWIPVQIGLHEATALRPWMLVPESLVALVAEVRLLYIAVSKTNDHLRGLTVSCTEDRTSTNESQVSGISSYHMLNINYLILIRYRYRYSGIQQIITLNNLLRRIGSYLCNYLWDHLYESWDQHISGNAQCFKVFCICIYYITLLVRELPISTPLQAKMYPKCILGKCRI